MIYSTFIKVFIGLDQEHEEKREKEMGHKKEGEKEQRRGEKEGGEKQQRRSMVPPDNCSQIQILQRGFSKNRHLGRFFHRVAMSVYIYMSPPHAFLAALSSSRSAVVCPSVRPSVGDVCEKATFRVSSE